jgi:predicted DNA-binding transcriptional regulator YafY
MSRHLERLLEIDTLLRANACQTAGSLAKAVERSERTVRKDIEFLRDRYHAPLRYSKIKGYHYTAPEWRLPSISLSKGELFALTLGARMLEGYAGFSYKEELRSAVARLAERLPEQSWVDLQQLSEERILFRSGVETDLNAEVWRSLEEACRQQRSVQMTYYTASRDAKSDRKFDPRLFMRQMDVDKLIVQALKS